MSRRFSSRLRDSLGSRIFGKLALASSVFLTLNLLIPFIQFDNAASSAYAAVKQKPFAIKLPDSAVNAGSLLVAFRSPVQIQGNRFVPVDNTSADEVKSVNAALDSLGTISLAHLFTNLPADKLNAARGKAMAATHAYVTNFTQVYQVKFNPAINSADAVNSLIRTSLVTAASPDWKLAKPDHDKDETKPSKDEMEQALNAPRATGKSKSSLIDPASLPVNYSYRTDGQSYHDAATNNVTGAAAMIADRFKQEPGQGETVLNISLGNIDNNSSVLEANQRYLEQAGYPKIPVWLSSVDSQGNVVLDPTATTQNDQGDLIEVDLDFSVMAPPPLGDPRMINLPPAGLGELLGAAYGANFRLINPLVNSTLYFAAAFLGGAFLQNPAPSVITASIGSSSSFGGFSDYFFEQDILIHDIVSLVVNGADIFVTISAGDGQTATQVAMNPNGLTGPTEVTNDPNKITDINDPFVWGDPSYSYRLTVEPQYVIDSGANNAGGNTLNDIYNNAPWNKKINPRISHNQHTTETRWTGSQSFHSGNGSRVNLSAPADDVLMLAQVEVGGVPVNPVATFPRLIGGTSASSPEIAAAAAVIRQLSRLLGHPLSAVEVRDLLVATARPNIIPAFDLNKTNVGPNLDLTAAAQALFDRAGVKGRPGFVRMTVAERKTALTYTDFRSSFYSDTPQDAVARTATIDLSKGLVAPSSRTNETIGSTGDNLNMPITFAADTVYTRPGAEFQWSLQYGDRRVEVPDELYNSRYPFVRLLPAEIFGLLDAPVTAPSDRVVKVTVKNEDTSLSMDVTFKGQPNSTYSHAVPPSFDPVFQPAGDDDNGNVVRFSYDLRGLRDGQGGQVDGGVLLVSDIDRAVPQAYPDRNLDAHGFKKKLNGLVGTVTISAADLPYGVGTYGIALRGTKGGQEVADSTSPWLPLRYAPKRQEIPTTPKTQAELSLWAEVGIVSNAPLFYEVADVSGSTRFNVNYDVRNVQGAKGTVIEFSAPTYNFASALFFTGNFGPTNIFVNNFTNPNGDRLDKGNNLGQPGGATNVKVNNTNGVITLDSATIGLQIPAGDCDSTFQVRVFATDGKGQIIGVAGNPSLLSLIDTNRAVCFG